MIPSLSTRMFGRPTHRFPEAGSTQDLLRRMAMEGAGAGTVVLADRQHAGRGRNGRSWFSPPGAQLFFSILLKPELPPQQMPLLNFAAAFGLLDLLDEERLPSPSVKWPNDIYVAGGKVAGILSELFTRPGEKTPCVALGCGVNLAGKTTDFPEDLRGKAVTLEEAAGRTFDRDEFFSRLLSAMEKWTDGLVRSGSGAIQDRFAARWLYKNRPISVKTGAGDWIGTADRIDADGALLLRTEKNGTVRVVSGDIAPLG